MAAHVIDSLVLELNLDSSKFTPAQQQALSNLRTFEDQAVRSGRNVEAQQRRLVDFMTDLKREVIGITSLMLGGRGVMEFVNHITNLDAATGRLAKTMDVGAEELSAWQGAIREMGGSAESANSAIGGLSGEMARFQLTGNSSMLPILSRLGIRLQDQNGHLKTATELWLDLSKAVEGMDPRQATAFLSMIPGANQDMINLALLGRKAMGDFIEDARRAGVTTRESAADAADYQKKLALLDLSAQNLGRTFLRMVAPAATAAMVSVANLLRAMANPSEAKPVSRATEDAWKPGGAWYETFAHPWRFTSLGLPFAVARALGVPIPGAGGERAAAAPATTGPTGPTTFVPADMMTPPPGFGPKLILDRVPPLGGVAPGAGTSIVRNRWSRSGGSSSATVNIGSVTVNAPHATDARGVARGFGTALDGYIRRSREAGHANGGTQ